MKKMSRIRLMLLVVCAAGIGIGSGQMMLNYNIHLVFVVPVVALVAWFQMGFFGEMWERNIGGKKA